MATDNAKKAGIKTSEFWVGVLTAPLIAIIAALLSAIGITIGDATIATLVAPALAYITSRGWVKASSLKATGTKK